MRKAIVGILSVLAMAMMVLSIGNNSVQADTTPSKLVVPYTTTPPIFDGNITTGEYAKAAYINFDVTGICGLDDGEVTIYAMNDGIYMYIALDVAFDTSNNLTYDNVWFLFNLNNDGHQDTLYDEDETPPYDDAEFDVFSDYDHYLEGSLVASGDVGFAKTNLSNDKHRIFETRYGVASLPAPGEYFGIFIWGEAHECFSPFNNKLPNLNDGGEPWFVGYGYPDDVVADLNIPGGDFFSNPFDVDNFAEWTLQAPFTAPVNVDKLPAFVTLFLLAIIGVTALFYLMKDDDISRHYRTFAIVMVAVCAVGLGLGYYQGWLAFS